MVCPLFVPLSGNYQLFSKRPAIMAISIAREKIIRKKMHNTPSRVHRVLLCLKALSSSAGSFVRKYRLILLPNRKILNEQKKLIAKNGMVVMKKKGPLSKSIPSESKESEFPIARRLKKVNPMDTNPAIPTQRSQGEAPFRKISIFSVKILSDKRVLVKFSLLKLVRSCITATQTF